MSGRRPKKAKKRGRRPWWEAGWISGLLLFAVALYIGLSLSGPVHPWWRVLGGESFAGWSSSTNPGGWVGAHIAGLNLVFGRFWCWLLPLTLGVLAFGFVTGKRTVLRPWLMRVLPLWIVTSAWIAQPQGFMPQGQEARWGGLVGSYLAQGFRELFGLAGCRIFLSLFLLVALVLVLKPWLSWLPGLLSRLGGVAGWMAACVRDVVGWPLKTLARIFTAWRDRINQKRAKSVTESVATEPPVIASDPVGRTRIVHDADAELSSPVAVDPVEDLVLPGADGVALETGGETGKVRPRRPLVPKKKRGPMVMPGIELLSAGTSDVQPVSKEALDQSADKLERTLHSFGVDGEVKDVRPGPVVTTYEYQPGTGVRVSQIVQRSDDLALAMRARSIRMEAPIPGKAAVGIEIPNPVARMVRLREVLEATAMENDQPLTVVLGKDVVGRPVKVDLASLPHLLVAGSTGSGKSVCLNAVICNLIMRNDPATLRLVLIDPKMLEMNVYNGIPHLLLPVVTDPQEALRALKWLVAQMEYRYRNLSKWSVRNIKQYNDKVEAGLIVDQAGDTVTEPMPYYLCVVDELADLMLQLGNDCEVPIARLAQKARAVGIHLILATQRPSVDVLTGVIKANIPCRIAFRVIQRNDSRTILDMNGAEQLLGNGDMLYLQPGRALPVRVHGSFIDVDECEAIAAHWQQYQDRTEEITLEEEATTRGLVTGEDEFFADARAIVVRNQSGSTSLLQRRLRIGYTRAGRLMDMLEEAGIVGPFNGSKAREVFLKPEELDNLNEGEA